MNDTALRYIAMLQQMPRYPGGITATELHSRLQGLGYLIDKRSVERDLVKLSEMFPLGSTEPRPARWFWTREASQTLLPGLSPAAALTFELASRHLTSLMPRSALEALDPMFQSARRILDELKSSGLGRWSDKVTVVPDTQPLLPPPMSINVYEVVHQALLTDRRIEISYRAADQDRAKRYPVNPLGLVGRGGSYYLVGTARDYPDPHIFSLHRVSDAVLLDEPSTKVPGFNLKRYVQDDRTFEMPRGGDLILELRVSPWLARHLDERRLSADQILTRIKGREEQRLKATVADTEQLRWWLRSFGPAVEVVRPASLRRELANEFAELAKLYQGRTQ